jgi:hypothetical protein
LKTHYLLSRLLAVSRYFFNFKKPVFTELDFIDLVVDEKPLFLIVWRSKNAHLLKIKSFKKYRKSEGSVILLIPSSSNHLTIQLKNIWRSIELRVDIQHTQLDEKTASFLLDKIKQVKPNGEIIWRTPLSMIHLQVKQLIILKRIAGVKNTKPVLKQNNFKIKAIHLTIKKQPTLQSEKLKYTNNTN